MTTIDPNVRATRRGAAAVLAEDRDGMEHLTRADIAAWVTEALDALEHAEAEMADLLERMNARADRYDDIVERSIETATREYLPEFAKALRDLASGKR